MIGFELENQNLLQIVTVAKNYSNHLPELVNGQPDAASSSTYGAGMLSYLGNVNYNFDDKYYLSASFRRDGSSRLSKDNRWANFWSVSGAWRLSKEGFMEDMPLFTDFKLRLPMVRMVICQQTIMAIKIYMQDLAMEAILLSTGISYQMTN